MWVSAQRTTGSATFDNEFGPCVSWQTYPHIKRHFDSGIMSNFEVSSIFTWMYADTASAACPAQSGSLAMTRITFADVICDAEKPCSLITAQEPESSFTMSPRSTTRPLYFRYFGSNSAFLRWHIFPISVAKWTLFFSLHASKIAFSFVPYCAQLHAGNSARCSHYLSTSVFASRFLIA